MEARTICRYVEILLEEQDRLDADQLDCLSTVARNANRLHRLITDLLDLSRSDAGMLRMELAPVSVSEVTRESVDSVRTVAAQKDIRLELDVADGLVCEGDAGRLAQGLDNLISNAVRYTPPGGDVWVIAKATAHSVSIEIADTGIGIPDDERHRLFERFFRASSATDAGIPGTGLGLSITRTIVEAHGGTIEACGRLGGGSVFTVALPRSATASCSLQKAA